jgi:glycosyltransferase involved in cell wall biosynthesis
MHSQCDHPASNTNISEASMHPNQQHNPAPKILFAATASISCGFYRKKLAYLRDAGFDVTIISSPGELLETLPRSEGATPIAIPMEREISPLKDLISLWKFYRVIKRVKPDLVDVSTPKAGLLGSIAALLARVPCRVYTLRGLRMETATGLKRRMLWLAEWLSCACAHSVVPLSESLRRRAVDLKLVPAAKANIVKHSGGVDLTRFTPRRQGSTETHALRQELGLTGKESVIGFVGRFVKDKGIRELVEAFRELGTTRSNLRLLLVGDFESGDPVEPEVRKYIESASTILRPGFVENTAPYYALMDVFVLPTYREGFPGVPLEAQASGVPVVTTTATGAIESVVDGVTGVLVPVGDSKALAKAIDELLAEPALRQRMGQAGRARTEREFRQDVIWDALIRHYQALLVKAGRPTAIQIPERAKAAKFGA